MLNNDGYSYQDGMRRVRVRLFHASPGAPAVDVYLNNIIVARNLAYKSFTPYLPLMPGYYHVQIFAAGTMNNPVLEQMVMIPDQDMNTVAVIGQLPNIGLLLIDPSAAPLIYGKSFVRFVHLSPNAPRVDVAVANGPVLFRNVAYQEITNYQIPDPGVYTLEVRPAGMDQVVLTVPGVALEANRFYTVYAVGLLGEEPPLEAVLAMDME